MTSETRPCQSMRYEGDRGTADPTSPHYPLNDIDRVRLNQLIRHRVRNLCGGTRMILDVLRTRIPESTSRPIEWKSLYREVEEMQRFSQRLDLLIEPLPPAQPDSLREVLQRATDSFPEQFPFCSLTMDGPETGMELPAGNWYGLILQELLDNAGRAAGEGGTVEVAWTVDPALRLVVVNSGAAMPDYIPTDPPVPFYTSAAARDGLGLAIVHRICLALGIVLAIRTDLEDTTAIAIGPEV